MYIFIAFPLSFWYLLIVKKVRFEWDKNKDKENQTKHGVAFEVAQYAFADPNRIIAEDLSHSQK